MTKNSQNKKGFILTLTLMILSIGLLIVAQFVQQGTVYLSFERMMVDREKAKILVFSTFQLAISQLTLLYKQDETKKTSGQISSIDNRLVLSNFLKYIFPILGCWQEIVLKEAEEGMSATMRFCITCENGKIPLNNIFDFKQRKFKGEGSSQLNIKKVMTELFENMKKFTQDKDLFDVFEKILKQREYKFNDVTELLQEETFFENFYNFLVYKPMDEKDKKNAIYLADLFTVYSQDVSLHPLLLSKSILEVLMIKPGYEYDVKRRKQLGNDILKDMKKGSIASVQNLWDTYLQKIYGKNFKDLSSGIASLLTLKFDPSVFSVLCYITVGRVTQKAIGIIGKKKLKENETLVLKKIYWL